MTLGAFGVIPYPAAHTGDTFQDIQKACANYAQQKALENLKAGKIPDLTSTQTDIDDCTAGMDRGRQIRQGLILTTGLIAAGFLGLWVWNRLG